MPQATTEEIQASHGAYTPPPGWEVQPKPAATEEEWSAKMKTLRKGAAYWRGMRLAHIFDDGWDEGTFQERKNPHLVFYYKGDYSKYAHSLELEEWGVSKSWVIIAQPK